MPSKKDSEPTFRFRGFQSPNYTMMPDELFDELMAVLSGAEFKVVSYIARRTLGFKKDSDNISLKQMVAGITTRQGRVLDRGTGLSKDSVAKAVKTLEEMGVILRNRRRSIRKGDEPTTYSLNLVPVSENRTPPIGEIGHPPVRKSDTQKTVEQKTVEQNSDDDAREPLELFGISKNQAQRLAASYPASLILEKLDQVSYLVERRSSLVSRNPQGFLIKAIEENYLPEKPKGYKSKAEREAQAQQRQAQDAAMEQARLDREQTIAAYKQHQQPKAISGTTLTTATSWEQTLRTLQGQMTAANFNTWLKHTVLVDCQQGQALIAAPSTFVADWLRARMVPIVKRALVETLGQPVELQFTVAPELTPPAEA